MGYHSKWPNGICTEIQAIHNQGNKMMPEIIGFEGTPGNMRFRTGQVLKPANRGSDYFWRVTNQPGDKRSRRKT